MKIYSNIIGATYLYLEYVEASEKYRVVVCPDGHTIDSTQTYETDSEIEAMSYVNTVEKTYKPIEGKQQLFHVGGNGFICSSK